LSAVGDAVEAVIEGGPRLSLEDLSAQIRLEGAGVESVAWEHTRRERA
jgi:hypothetical protein